MGWFDKKSWQLRRKIRDLQSELAVAEREGKYVVEQGLFFAELQEMGDATIMVLGTADHLDSEEEEVIRNFFDRNGFTVEALRLDRDQKTLAAVEIIPPEELTRRVAKLLKESGYRLVDDSDQERPSNIERRNLTLSSIIRSISALFASHVHQLVISTPLKMNMEGNRLLHWTPLIREALLRKVSQDVVQLCREPFINAYNHYYGRFGEMTHPENFQTFTDEESEDNSLEMESASTESVGTEAQVSDHSTEPWTKPTADGATPSFTNRAAGGGFHQKDMQPATSTADRAIEAAYVLAKLYKALIGASSERRVRNAEVLLDSIGQYFSAKSICLLSRNNADAPFKLQANSGKKQCLETGTDGTVTCDTTLFEQALAANKITAVAPNGNGHIHPKAVVVPVELDGEAEVLIYIVEPEAYDSSANSADSHHASLFAQAFREFPDLVLPGVTERKN